MTNTYSCPEDNQQHQGAPMISDALFAAALGLAGATFLFLALS